MHFLNFFFLNHLNDSKYGQYALQTQEKEENSLTFNLLYQLISDLLPSIDLKSL